MKYLKFILAGAVLLGSVTVAVASVSFTTPTQPDHTYKNFTFFSATTTTATSTNTSDGGGYFVVNGALKIMMYFTHGGTATTSTAGGIFKVQGTRDGTNWTDVSRMLGMDISATATSTVTVQGATTTTAEALDITNKTFYAIRCISTEASTTVDTNGEQTCAASAEF